MRTRPGKKVTSGAQLRKTSRPLLTVPDTGNTYRVRRPDIADVINTGALPENFTGKTLATLGRESSGPLSDRELLDNSALKRATVIAALLEPRVSENPQTDDEVEFDDLPPEDRDYIYRWATRQLPETVVETSLG